jgi:hypothetical protein
MGGPRGKQFTPEGSYLEVPPSFENASGTVNTSYEDTNFTDFEKWFLISSESASGRLDAVFRGRLGASHTTISAISLFVKAGATGSPQFDIQIYCEGQGSSNQYTGTYSSQGAVPGSGSATEITISSSDITNQPSSNKRYFIFVRAYLDVDESMYLARPFVKHT